MPISIPCPHCSATLNAPSKLIGQSVRCSKCKEKFVVTDPAEEPVLVLDDLEVIEDASDSGFPADDGYANRDLGQFTESGSTGLPDPLDLGQMNLASDSNERVTADAWPGMVTSVPITTNDAPKIDDAKNTKLPLFIGIGASAIVASGALIFGLTWMLSGKPRSNSGEVAQPTATLDSKQTETKGDLQSEVSKSDDATKKVEIVDTKVPSDLQRFESWGPRSIRLAKENKAQYIRIATTPDGKRELLSAAVAYRDSVQANNISENSLPDGEGVQLGTNDEATALSCLIMNQIEDPDLLVKSSSYEGFSVSRLKQIGVPLRHDADSDNNQISYLKSVWAPDGTTLYLLTGDELAFQRSGPRQILKIDTKSWKIVGKLQTKDVTDRINDLCFSKDGLVFVLKREGTFESPLMIADGDKEAWFPLSHPSNADCMLVVLDPETMKPKKYWEIPEAYQISGSPLTSTVFAFYEESHFAAIDCQRGQVMNLGAFPNQLGHPIESPDGKWLFARNTLQQNTGMMRYAVDENKLVFSESLKVDRTAPLPFLSPDCNAISVQGESESAAFSALDFGKELAREKTDKARYLIYDPVSNFRFTSGTGAFRETLQLQISDGSYRVEFYLHTTNSTDSRPRERDGKSNAGIASEYKFSFPWGMTLAPQGRGNLIFADNATYWIELKDAGKRLALNPSKIPSVYLSTSPREKEIQAKLKTVPPAKKNLFSIKRIDKEHKGKVFAFPTNYREILEFTVDSTTGDIWLIGELPNGNRYLGVLLAADLDKDEIPVGRGIEFPDRTLNHVVCKEFNSRKIVVISRGQALLSLDSKTLQPITSFINNSAMITTEMAFHASSSDDPYLYWPDPKNGMRLDLENFAFSDLQAPMPLLENYPSNSRLMDVPSDYRKRFRDNRAYETGIEKPGSVSHRSFPSNEKLVAEMLEMPIVVSHKEEFLNFHDRSNLSNFHKTELPPNLAIQLRSQHGHEREYQFHDDIARNRILMAGTVSRVEFGEKRNRVALAPVERSRRLPSTLWIVGYDEIDFPKVPNFSTLYAVPKSVEPLSPVVIDVLQKDPQVELTLLEGPNGADLRKGKIEWQPELRDSGFHKFLIGLKSGDSKTVQKFYCSIGKGKVEVPFLIGKVAADSTGKRLLCWTKQESVFQSKADSISVVSSETGKVLATRHLKSPISDAVLTDEFAYILYGKDHCIEKCNAQDLKVVDTMAMTGSLDSLASVFDKYLVAFDSGNMRDGRERNSRIVSFPDLKPNKLSTILDHPSNRRNPFKTPQGDWILGPVVLDRETQSIAAINNLSWTGIIPLETFIGRGSIGGEMGFQDPYKPLKLDGKWTIQSFSKTFDSDNDKNYNSLLGIEIRDESNNSSTTLPIWTYSESDSPNNFQIECAGDTLFARVNGRLFITSTEAVGLKRSKKIDNELSARTKEKVTVISSNKKIEIKVNVEGAVGDVTIECPTSRGIMGSFLSIDSKKSTITLDGAGFLRSLLEGVSLRSATEALATEFPELSSNAKKIDKYVENVEPNLKMVSKQAGKGVPLFFPLDITVKDEKTKTPYVLTHNIIFYVPRQTIESKMPKPEETKRLLEQTIKPRASSGDQALPLFWKPTREAIVAEMQLRLPTKRIEKKEELNRAALIEATRKLLPDLFRANFATTFPEPERTFKLRGGKSIKGYLNGFEKNTIFAAPQKDGSGLPQKIELTDIETSDLASFYEVVRKHVTEYEKRIIHFSDAIIKFQEQFGCLPFEAILDKDEKPLLSWRVLMLPYIGYPELFQLFRLDEPWDSEHNKTLIPYMPVIYTGTFKGMESGLSTMKAIVGPDSAMPHEGILSLIDLETGPNSAALWGEASPGFAVVWTKPEDIENTPEQTWRDQMHLVSDSSNNRLNYSTWQVDGRKMVH